jgi:nitrite reductase/ring-hydroxylating ferredoxin subunit
MRYFITALRTLRNYLPSEKSVDKGNLVEVGKSADFKEGRMRVVDFNGDSVILTRYQGKVCAVINKCAHLAVALDSGTLKDGVITCPLHNSKFDVCTGENLDWVTGVAGVRVPKWTSELIALGQEPRGIRSYTVVEENDAVFIQA